MSWRRYFTPAPVSASTGTNSPMGNGNKAGPARSNYSSYLPDIYVGSPNRIERYMQYDTMDMDPEVNAALDILAEFCTQKNKENNTTFHLSFKDKATNSEIRVLREYVQQSIGYSSSSWIVPAIYGAGGAATFSNPTLRGSAGAVFIRYLSV